MRNVVFRQVEEDIDHDLKLKDVRLIVLLPGQADTEQYNWRYRIKTIALIQSSFKEVLMLVSMLSTINARTDDACRTRMRLLYWIR